MFSTLSLRYTKLPTGGLCNPKKKKQSEDHTMSGGIDETMPWESITIMGRCRAPEDVHDLPNDEINKIKRREKSLNYIGNY